MTTERGRCRVGEAN